MKQRDAAPGVDLNLLVALDALLAERSVSAAARRLGLSASATSRALARLRAATGDPLLVQAGRSLVATPFAEELAGRVHALTREASAVLRPAARAVELPTLRRTFTLRAGQAFVELAAVPLLAAVTTAAPGVRLRFVPKPDKDARPLREGVIDLEIGVLGSSAPELRFLLLFRDRHVGLVRAGHPLLAGGAVTPGRYAACAHVVASRRGRFTEAVDDALGELGLERDVRLVVPGYPDAMRVVRNSDLVALVPRSCLGHVAAPGHAAGLECFELPVPLPGFNVSAIWHPRLDADPAHRWLRETVVAVCRVAFP